MNMRNENKVVKVEQYYTEQYKRNEEALEKIMFPIVTLALFWPIIVAPIVVILLVLGIY
jgi:hypothetical protein